MTTIVRRTFRFEACVCKVRWFWPCFADLQLGFLKVLFLILLLLCTRSHLEFTVCRCDIGPELVDEEIFENFVVKAIDDGLLAEAWSTMEEAKPDYLIA